jgi:hypothetical protein
METCENEEGMFGFNTQFFVLQHQVRSLLKGLAIPICKAFAGHGEAISKEFERFNDFNPVIVFDLRLGAAVR